MTGTIRNYMDTQKQAPGNLAELDEGAPTLAGPKAEVAPERVTKAHERLPATCTNVRLQHLLGQPVRDYYRP
jgi:hypothetical protein